MHGFTKPLPAKYIYVHMIKKSRQQKTPLKLRPDMPLVSEDHTLGSPHAPVTLLEYGDFECPHCGEVYPVIKELLREWGDDLLFAYRHFPLIDVHPHAEHAAEASEIAGAEGKFWPMHDTLFENQDALDDLSLLGYAELIGVDPEVFAIALRDGIYRPRVARDILSGIYGGVNGTPTFFINGYRYVGSHSYRALAAALEAARKLPPPKID
jgi:protein-disulfide isomerase